MFCVYIYLRATSSIRCIYAICIDEIKAFYQIQISFSAQHKFRICLKDEMKNCLCIRDLSKNHLLCIIHSLDWANENKNRKNLKENPRKLFIEKDLSTTTYTLFYLTCRQDSDMTREEEIYSTTTIFIIVIILICWVCSELIFQTEFAKFTLDEA